MRFGMLVALLTLALVASITDRAAAQQAAPDLRGTWKGQSESVVFGGGNPHHAPTGGPAAPRYTSVPFTLVIDKQDGRRFSGTFASARSNETVVAVLSRAGTIYLVDDDGYTTGTLLAPNRMELCYMHLSPASRIASCTELTKQP